MSGPVVLCCRPAWCVYSLSPLCSFGVKVMDFQAIPRRGGTLNRKHMAPAFQPPLPPTEAGPLAQAVAEQHTQGPGAEPSGAASAPLPCPAEQAQNQGTEDTR